jgi:phosphoribosylformimino-5-aminoimidazole carboxamide ribotide isomerase
MTVYPAIDLRGGRCVRLWQGAFERETVYGDDPVAVARRFAAEGARWLHVVDLDGARAGRPVQAALVAAICAAVDIPVQVGGGLRRLEAIEDAIGAGAARAALEQAGAETIDAARERWWVGLRSAEEERYEGGAAAFSRDERLFRQGFEAALSPAVRAKTWEEALPELRARHADAVDAPAFRHGWERGQDYQRELGFGSGLRKIA